ncbi:MBL fold metallo-hydrolase [Thermodesulforhabdus norvegica]|uniref:Ribonuclease BN, tRNA processing enzyme n=1 Tax=Thermodesulforhabdus norvegica TaxID=39841 RepID=A0A1I4VRS5_9BACT|nr:ribonuclease Z [Thermodesulforhabdus norvegica]SFN03981.1 Ribonuclease BN, tRNA processing enzyme [Thermodesulforhabdus norvegica]
MKVLFVGVGEACDDRFPNTSFVISARSYGNEERNILFDCGFSVPMFYWKYFPDPEFLDLIWISHFHGDHFMGLPALLLRMWEMGRTKPLIVLGQRNIQEVVTEALELAYPGFMSRFRFSLSFLECEPGKDLELNGLRWAFAETDHSKRNLCVAVTSPDGTVCYSGDGRPTSESTALAREATLLVHEAFDVKPAVPGHGTVDSALSTAEEAGVKNLALVHLQRDVRRWHELQIERRLASTKTFQAFLPRPGDRFEF